MGRGGAGGGGARAVSEQCRQIEDAVGDAPDHEGVQYGDGRVAGERRGELPVDQLEARIDKQLPHLHAACSGVRRAAQARVVVGGQAVHERARRALGTILRTASCSFFILGLSGVLS